MSGSKTKTQYLTAICVNILSIAGGASISWTSPYLPQLKAQNSPLGEPLSVTDASWIGSLLAIGALSGGFFFGWLSEKIGRVRSLQLCAVPQIVWWTILIFSHNVFALMIGRFLAGFSSGGTFNLVPLYVTEISQDAIRGSLGSFFILSTNTGMLVMFAAGNVFDYFITPRIMILIPILFLAIFSFFPETPFYLLKSGKMEKAEKALKFFRCSKKGEPLNENEKIELEKIKKKIQENENKKKISVWNELKSPAARKAVFIGVALICFNQLSGFFMFLNYTADIFIEAGSSFTPNQSAVVCGAILVLGSIVSLSLVDEFNRKKLFFVTAAGQLLGLLMMGVHSLCKDKQVSGIENFKFIPIISLSLFIFVGSMGRLPLSYVMMSEIMPLKIRSFGISTANTCNWILAFLLLQCFSLAVEAFKFHNCMFIFGGIVLAGMIFVIFCVPETKNKSFDDIEKSLTKQKKNEDIKSNYEMEPLDPSKP